MHLTIIEEYITYDKNHHIFICRHHGFAVPPDRIQRHFREFHKAIPIEIRNQLIQYGNSLPLKKPEEISTPSPQTKPIADLKLIADGYMCQFQGCFQCASALGTMQEHCRVRHGRKIKDEEMWQPQAIQTFFQAQHCKYD